MGTDLWYARAQARRRTRRMNEPSARSCANCGGPIPEGKRRDAIYCREVCGSRNRNRRYAKRNPDRVRQNREVQNNKTERRMLSRTRHRARRNGVDFDITEADINIPKFCPVLGIALHGRQGRGFHRDSPSLDRIVPSRGYIPGNVRVISARANLLKNDATVSELQAVIDDLRRLSEEGHF